MSYQTEKRVVVFARNSDPVRNNPLAMAESLLSGWFPRPFRGSPVQSLEEVGLVSIWTRDPSNLLGYPELIDALWTCEEKNIAIELQVSVTGFGGRFPFVELDVPTPEQVAECVREILCLGFTIPDLVRVRIDPFLSMRVRDLEGHDWTVSNMRLELVEHLFDLFRPLGVRRYIFSHRDAGNYDPTKARIRDRFDAVGIYLCDDNPAKVASFLASVRKRSDRCGLWFGLCANPPGLALPYQGCIRRQRPVHGEEAWAPADAREVEELLPAVLRLFQERSLGRQARRDRVLSEREGLPLLFRPRRESRQGREAIP